MILNFVVVVVTTVLNILFGIVEIRLFLMRYGSAINGLVQTGNQILGYLSLIEAGIGAAFLYKMYKPMAENNYARLSSVYNGFKKSMRQVVVKMFAAACVVSVIYPLFLKNNGIEYIYMLSIFVLLSMKAILPYLLTIVPKYMIIVKEQKYKADLISNLCKIATYAAEIILLVFFKNIPLQGLLLVCVMISVVTGICFQYTMRKLYGNNLDPYAEPDFTANEMSGDVLTHNISRLIFNSTDNIIISIFGSLHNVTMYSNYNMISNQVTGLFQNIIDGAAASMGIKIAKQDKNSYYVYRELLTGVYWAAGVVTAVFFAMVNDFVDLCFGTQYCVGSFNCSLFGTIMYTGIILPCIFIARNACGLYKESKGFTIAQTVANILISVALVPFMGITGVLLGTVISRVVITVPFNYILVDKKVFPQEKSKWYELIAGVAVTGVTALASIGIINIINIGNWIENDIIVFIFNAVVSSLVSVAIITPYYIISDRSFRQLLKRLVTIIKGAAYKIIHK